MNLNFFKILCLALALQSPMTQAKTENKKAISTASLALLGAASEGSISNFKKILKNKTNLNVQDQGGNTALMLAITSDHPEIAKIILEKNTDINIKNNNGQTALYISVINGQTDIALQLIKEGAQLENISEDGDSALLAATTSNAMDIMTLVIEKNGSLLNKPNKFGTTPLMESARFGSAKTTALLLKAGANKSLKNSTGKTALDIAIKAQNEEVINLLKSN